MTQESSTRTLEGVEAPAVGTYTIDSAHTSVGFVARHMMVSKVRGVFGVFSGTIVVGERPEDSSVEVSIEASSIDTTSEMRDNHLRSPDFLHVEKFPEIRYRSTRVERSGPKTLQVKGDLTIKDVTRPVDLAVEYEGAIPDMRGGTRTAFSATGEIDREEFDILWNAALEGGGVLVGKKVKIELDVAAVQAVEQAA
jgi:polyisoprenoid-binding protein YceI